MRMTSFRPRDGLRGKRGLVGRLVGDAAVDPRVPRVEEHLPLLGPRAVPQAELEAGDAYNPVRGGTQHRHLWTELGASDIYHQV